MIAFGVAVDGTIARVGLPPQPTRGVPASGKSMPLTLTALARHAAGAAAGRRYRDADTGAWYQPGAPGPEVTR